MPTTAVSAIDPREFQRLLSRNVKLPLIGGVVGAVVFVALIFYLLSVISWVEHTDRVTRDASEMQRLSIDLETGMRGYLISGDETFLQPYESAQPRLAAGMVALRKLVGDNPAQVDRLDRIATLQAAWNQFAAEMIGLRRTGGDYQEAIRLGRGKRLTDDMRTGYSNFMNIEQSLRFQRNNEANNTALAIVGLFVFFTVAMTGLLAFFGRRQLMRLSDGYGVVLQKQAAHAETLQRQAWLRGAQTELTGELVGELSAQEMGRKVLGFFAHQMGSSVGAMYVRERNGELRRVASYGFSPAAEASPQVFAAGQGLVGQAAAERRLTVVEPVTADYLKVNSGLGDMAPRAAVLMPVSHNGFVNGVIELGLLHSPDARTTELLDLVAGNVGSSVAAKSRARSGGNIVQPEGRGPGCRERPGDC